MPMRCSRGRCTHAWLSAPRPTNWEPMAMPGGWPGVSIAEVLVVPLHGPLPSCTLCTRMVVLDASTLCLPAVLLFSSTPSVHPQGIEAGASTFSVLEVLPH